MMIYSKLLSISSCFNTLVWLVSLSSPAKNISSTMLYTLKQNLLQTCFLSSSYLVEVEHQVQLTHVVKILIQHLQ